MLLVVVASLCSFAFAAADVTIDGKAPSGCYQAPKTASVPEDDVIVFDPDAPCGAGKAYIHNAAGSSAPMTGIRNNPSLFDARYSITPCYEVE